jgi:predicted aspartyl protease
MGLTSLSVEVGNVGQMDVMRPLEFVLDSGLIYSVVPRGVLKDLGIRSIARHEFRLGDGSRVARDKGVALFRYGDRTGGTDVIFGETGDDTILGELTLAALGLALDPLRRKLIELPMTI